MKTNDPIKEFDNLPVEAGEFIKLIIKKMRYRKKVRQEVMVELAGHFEDGLRECKTADERDKKTKRLIEEFGDPQLLGLLLRRAKKRSRTLKQKIIIRSLQAIGIIVLYIIIRIIYLMSGSPTISINYVDWLNNLVRANRSESENAKEYYNKAIELYIKRPSVIEQKNSVIHPADYNEVEMGYLSKWLKDNQLAFEMLRQGASKPYYWLTYSDKSKSKDLKAINKHLPGNYFPAAVVENIMGLQSDYRKLCYAMSENIIYQANHGQIEAALDDCIVLQKYANHLQGKRLLIEQLVGIAIEAVGHYRMLDILKEKQISHEILRDFYEKYSLCLSNMNNDFSFEAENAFLYNLIQYGFTDDGKGNGRVLKDGLIFVTSDKKKSILQLLGGSFPDRKETVKTIEEYFSKQEQVLQQTPWQLHNCSDSINELNDLAKKSFIFQLQPAIEKMNQIKWRSKTEQTALQTVLAVLLYQGDKSIYPTDLRELVKSGYLKQVPMDPFSDKPLVYKKTDNGFMLYSVGENFKDDGGKMGTNPVYGKLDKWAQNGDTVFWPVQH